MLCLGQKKSLLSPRLNLTAQGLAQQTDDQSQVWNHSAIQAPLLKFHISHVSRPANSDEDVYEKLTGKKLSEAEKKKTLSRKDSKKKKKKISRSVRLY